jgi:glutaminase
LPALTLLTQNQLDQWVIQARSQGDGGQIPAYVPRLAEVNREWVAIALRLSTLPALAAGQIAQPFVLMSVIKPFLLLFLLEHLGQKAVFSRVGVRPSDLSFHSLTQLTSDRGFARNPMLNSGAISLADLLPEKDGRANCERLCTWLNQQSGATLKLDEVMLASVRSLSNETNYAIANMLMQSGYLSCVETAIDTYNHICCLSGTVDDLAKVGLLLAQPQSQIATAHQRIVNALMLTCGLYEASGEFAVQIGLPIKSGVSGAMLAIVPRLGAIACYSPALDDIGNSIAGLFLLQQIANTIDLSIF